MISTLSNFSLVKYNNTLYDFRTMETTSSKIQYVERKYKTNDTSSNLFANSSSLSYKIDTFNNELINEFSLRIKI